MKILRHNKKIKIILKQKVNYSFVKLKLSRVKCDKGRAYNHCTDIPNVTVIIMSMSLCLFQPNQPRHYFNATNYHKLVQNLFDIVYYICYWSDFYKRTENRPFHSFLKHIKDGEFSRPRILWGLRIAMILNREFILSLLSSAKASDVANKKNYLF